METNRNMRLANGVTEDQIALLYARKGQDLTMIVYDLLMPASTALAIEHGVVTKEKVDALRNEGLCGSTPFIVIGRHRELMPDFFAAIASIPFVAPNGSPIIEDDKPMETSYAAIETNGHLLEIVGQWETTPRPRACTPIPERELPKGTIRMICITGTDNGRLELGDYNVAIPENADAA